MERAELHDQPFVLVLHDIHKHARARRKKGDGLFSLPSLSSLYPTQSLSRAYVFPFGYIMEFCYLFVYNPLVPPML